MTNVTKNSIGVLWASLVVWFYSGVAMAADAKGGNNLLSMLTNTKLEWLHNLITFALLLKAAIELLSNWSKIISGDSGVMGTLISIASWVILAIFWKDILNGVAGMFAG